MKTIIAAIALIFVLTANVGTVSAHEGEHDGYEQHESRDQGEKDRHEHGDKDKNRGEQHAEDRDGASGHAGTVTEPVNHFWDWVPF